MKKSVGIITFHASHNYGSMLQAYALQQTVMKMGNDCEIINFRTERQRNCYKPSFLRGSFLGKAKRTLILLPFVRSLLKKHQLFESFLSDDLNVTKKEYSTLEELDNAEFSYDYYISGSDQIWNTICFDFDWAYFLPFVKKGKRIAYAPSMGPNPKLQVVGDNSERIKSLLENYNYVGVREKETAERLKDFSDKEYPVMLDPTMLLSADEWDAKAGEVPLIKGDYIFLYMPWLNKEIFNCAKLLSERLKIKVVVSQIYDGALHNSWLLDFNYSFYFAVGPNEFLNLCKHAKCILGSSFHLVVFSILLRTPFYAVEGMQDSRVANILKLTGLENRSLKVKSTLQNVSLDIDFDRANESIEQERIKCLEWLKQSLQ